MFKQDGRLDPPKILAETGAWKHPSQNQKLTIGVQPTNNWEGQRRAQSGCGSVPSAPMLRPDALAVSRLVSISSSSRTMCQVQLVQLGGKVFPKHVAACSSLSGWHPSQRLERDDTSHFSLCLPILVLVLATNLETNPAKKKKRPENSRMILRFPGACLKF